MKAWLWALCVAGCGALEQRPVPRAATLDGRVLVPPGLSAPIWVFLSAPESGLLSTPLMATAIGRLRVSGGDSRYVFAAVEPNPYLVTGILDADGDFDGREPVLAQPTAGDRRTRRQEVNLQPGKTTTVDLVLEEPVAWEPPAFIVDGLPDAVRIDPRAALTEPLRLTSDMVGERYARERSGFVFSLVDADGDGRVDDADGDGAPDLSLAFALQWKPLPGQLAEGLEVLVPLIPDVRSVLAGLGADLKASVRVDEVTVYLAPQAIAIRGTSLEVFGAPPAGMYGLVVRAATGQFWRLPNALAEAGQQTRFYIDLIAP